MFAAEFIVQRILEGKGTLKNILEAEPKEMSSLREVLQYVVQGLSRCKPRLLERRWPELEQALRDAGVVSAADWEECLRICPDVEQLAKPAALSKLKEDKTWRVETGRDVALVAAMLPYAQPDLLEVKIKPDDLSKRRWAELVQRRDGRVRLELQNPADDKYKSNEDLLLPMLGTRFAWLSLRGSRLRAEELPSLLLQLHGAGVRTGGGGSTRTVVYGEGDVYLYIRDDMHPGGPAVPSDAELQAAYHRYQRLRGQ
ncbi:uncharacterized protein LOC125178914 [Hyalella azteca]|uniref:Uncharacterized protein LOC125178914 n=1 Tax=Hyalella azteca TaxID=294128 RepID=A0A979FRG9_HYAAZ|nr:uncharacterized protein LOC125178914 [Hyalella azteca]